MTKFCRGRGKTLTITLHVQPRAKKTEIIGVYGDVLKVKVAAPPVDGEANEELVRFFSKYLGVPKSQLTILQGGQSRHKVLEVGGFSVAELTGLLIQHGYLTIQLG